jgi:hypothetical protein
MNKLIAIGSLALVFGSGAWCGYMFSPVEGTAAAPAPAPTLPSLVNRDRGLLPGRADVDMSTLRVMVRQEMDAALAAKGSGNSVAQTPAQTAKNAVDAPAPSAETLTKRRTAEEQIDTMMAQGHWGNDERFNFQQDLAALDPEQKDHALEQLTTAINSGTLQVSTDGPPL